MISGGQDAFGHPRVYSYRSERRTGCLICPSSVGKRPTRCFRPASLIHQRRVFQKVVRARESAIVGRRSPPVGAKESRQIQRPAARIAARSFCRGSRLAIPGRFSEIDTSGQFHAIGQRAVKKRVVVVVHVIAAAGQLAENVFRQLAADTCIHLPRNIRSDSETADVRPGG